MRDAPERIWFDRNMRFDHQAPILYQADREDDDIEYVRADLAREIRTSQAVTILQGKIGSLTEEVETLRAERDRIRRETIEECAKVCEELRNENYSQETDEWVAGTLDCAAAIRARGEQQANDGTAR